MIDLERNEGQSIHLKDPVFLEVPEIDGSGASRLECGELPAFLGSPGNPSDSGAHLTASLHSPSVPQPVTNSEGNTLMTSEKPKGPRTPRPTGLGPDV